VNASGSANVADVIIVGGGLMGASAALFLRNRGRSVILLERGLVGQQASGVNFGNVRRQAYAKDARDYGLDLEIIAGNSLRDRYPYLGREVLMGSLGPIDGHANPRLVAPAFGRAASRAGARVEENTEVLAIEKVGEDFCVETRDRGQFRAPVVLITAGAWATAMAEKFGEPVPAVARGPQMGVTEPVPYRIEPTLGVSSPLVEETVYLRQVSRGNIVFGGGNRNDVNLETIRAYPDPENTLNQMPQLRRLLPGIANLRIIRTWSGIEGYLPDDLPVMGSSAKVPGLYYAFGFCGAGFQIGPAVGDVMAELIDTATTVTPIEPFHIRRFAAGQPTA